MKNRNLAETKNTAFLFALGFSTSITQVVLLREFLAAYGGNEIITSVFLSLWMLITGAGSLIARGRYTNRTGIITGFILLGYTPVLLLYLINLLKPLLFITGVQPGLYGIILAMVLILPVFCLLSGFMFTCLASTLSLYTGENLFNRAYGTESTGSLTGGLIFTFILASFLDNFECAVLTAIFVSLVAIISGMVSGFRLTAIFITVLAASVIIFTISGDISVWPRQFIYPGQEIIKTTDTRYGNLTVTRTADQLNFYSNNIFLYATGDVQKSEEAVLNGYCWYPED
jgi:predicted membrane-bound spermidine synthase